MNDTNIDSQSESILLQRLDIQTISSAGVDANIVIFIVIVLGVNGA